MSLSLGVLFYVVILVLNGLAVLNEERFLSKIGLGSTPSNLSNAESVKTKLVALVSAVRTLLRLPLIVINVVVILYSLTIG